MVSKINQVFDFILLILIPLRFRFGALCHLIMSAKCLIFIVLILVSSQGN